MKIKVEISSFFYAVLVLCLVCLISSCQSKNRNHSGECFQINIEDIPFVGLPTTLFVEKSNVSVDYLKIQADGKEFPVQSNGSVEFELNRPGYFNILLIDGRNNEELFSKQIDVKYLPLPYAQIMRADKSIISKNQLLDEKGVVAYLENWDIDYTIPVLRFNMLFELTNGPKIYPSDGQQFSRDQIMRMKKLQVDDYFVITDIFVQMPDKRKVRLDDLLYKIM